LTAQFLAEQRGLAMGVFGAMPWLGPVVGPLVSQKDKKAT
jgi:MFS family permease